ncbi:hypothetical protein GCM10010919_32880 [Alishewanella longhuensis]|uniref:DUF4394 domain-containing protein n=1 Tax=Alishewanella longhuensis TaxID=1091037 RepID=A0ABQ3L1T8_9ALTE|nr:DUF4394 domain-containing protein [Alishewanella longhuensis]GHG77330.1 hypothetical protein GCM10010919_32880 [Alishewanella longhuensis]
MNFARSALVASFVVGLGLANPVAANTLPELKGNESLWLVTQSQQLMKVNAKSPMQILEQKTLTGLADNEQIQGIDYRVAYGVLFALSNKGQLYTINTATGTVSAVGEPLTAGTLQTAQYGFDFNPAADRIRVVNALGQNLRLHPETGALASTDPALHYAATDRHAGKEPAIVAAAYTYNQQDAKLTTNYAIDMAMGTLVTQGSVEGTEPAVSPNTGQLFTVGALGITDLQQVSFDISDLNNIGLIAVSTKTDTATTLYQVDLATGKAHKVGVLAEGSALAGIAIEP